MARVAAGLATIPPRSRFLSEVVGSILPQIDVLYLAFNGYRAVPDAYRREPRIAARCFPEDSLADAAKFWGAAELRDKRDAVAYYFSLDDDLIYPSTYVADMIGHLRSFGDAVVASLHGTVLGIPPLRSYYRDRLSLPCLGPVPHYFQVHLPGTGAMAYPWGTLALDLADFRRPYMADIWVGIACQKQGVPVVTVPHEEQGRYLAYDPSLRLEDTIWGRFHLQDQAQTDVINEFHRTSGWRLPPLPRSIVPWAAEP
jgi:hypothetical protein